MLFSWHIATPGTVYHLNNTNMITTQSQRMTLRTTLQIEMYIKNPFRCISWASRFYQYLGHSHWARFAARINQHSHWSSKVHQKTVCTSHSELRWVNSPVTAGHQIFISKGKERESGVIEYEKSWLSTEYRKPLNRELGLDDWGVGLDDLWRSLPTQTFLWLISN